MKANTPKEITLRDIEEVLDLTIKQDSENKLITFLCALSIYTEDSQFNISFNAPSSTGKSHIPLEIAKLFPAEDVLQLGSATPASFFHESGKYNKEKNEITIDLSKKLIVFLDQPNYHLLERLRALLSHDSKRVISKITDKNNRGGNRTKTVIMIGFPAVIFCSAGTRINEQEATRFILLSPDINQTKLRQSVDIAISKSSNDYNFEQDLVNNPERNQLIERVNLISKARIIDIRVNSNAIKQIKNKFYKDRKTLKPRDQRDIKRIISLVKTIALLNLWHREKIGSSITANAKDVETAFELWNRVHRSQEYNLSPYMFNFYEDIILDTWNKSEDAELVGLDRETIARVHFKKYGRPIDATKLRTEILPAFEQAGIIAQVSDPNDKRKTLVVPLVGLNNSEKMRG